MVEERSPTLAFEACKIEETTILWQINSVGSTMQHKGRKDPLDFQISVTLSLPKSDNKTFSFYNDILRYLLGSDKKKIIKHII